MNRVSLKTSLILVNTTGTPFCPCLVLSCILLCIYFICIYYICRWYQGNYSISPPPLPRQLVQLLNDGQTSKWWFTSSSLMMVKWVHLYMIIHSFHPYWLAYHHTFLIWIYFWLLIFRMWRRRRTCLRRSTTCPGTSGGRSSEIMEQVLGKRGINFPNCLNYAKEYFQNWRNNLEIVYHHGLAFCAFILGSDFQN